MYLGVAHSRARALSLHPPCGRTLPLLPGRFPTVARADVRCREHHFYLVGFRVVSARLEERICRMTCLRVQPG